MWIIWREDNGKFPLCQCCVAKASHTSFWQVSSGRKAKTQCWHGEKRHLYGRSQPSGEWTVEPSEETGSVWVWGHISRISGGNLRWRRLLLTSTWYFVLLETQASNMLWVKKAQMPFTLGLNIIWWGYPTHFKMWSHWVSSFVSSTLFAWSIFR